MKAKNILLPLALLGVYLFSKKTTTKQSDPATNYIPDPSSEISIPEDNSPVSNSEIVTPTPTPTTTDNTYYPVNNPNQSDYDPYTYTTNNKTGDVIVTTPDPVAVINPDDGNKADDLHFKQRAANCGDLYKLYLEAASIPLNPSYPILHPVNNAISANIQKSIDNLLSEYKLFEKDYLSYLVASDLRFQTPENLQKIFWYNTPGVLSEARGNNIECWYWETNDDNWMSAFGVDNESPRLSPGFYRLPDFGFVAVHKFGIEFMTYDGKEAENFPLIDWGLYMFKQGANFCNIKITPYARMAYSNETSRAFAIGQRQSGLSNPNWDQNFLNNYNFD